MLVCFLIFIGKSEAVVASHILQFMFIGSTGFKFPVCYFPTTEIDPFTLYHQFWHIIFDLGELGFKVCMYKISKY